VSSVADLTNMRRSPALSVDDAQGHRARHWSRDLCQIYTRPAFVRMVVELAGLRRVEDPLAVRILEPGAGTGAFAIPIAIRLIAAARRCGTPLSRLHDRIRAIEIDPEAVASIRKRLRRVLNILGVAPRQREALVSAWVQEADFLYYDESLVFTHVLGNPPFVRWSNLPAVLRPALQAENDTLRAKADIHVAFIERCLGRLADDGCITMLSPNTWLIKRFGADLRERLSSAGSLERVVRLDRFRPFVVGAKLHPIVFRFRRGRRDLPGAVLTPSPGLAPSAVTAATLAASGSEAILRGRAPVLLSNRDLRRAQDSLAERFPSLTGAGVEIRVGSTTGCNPVFLLSDPSGTGIEACRLRRFVAGRDVRSGRVAWSGTFVVDVFGADGKPVLRDDFPGLWAYIDRHRSALTERASASRGWFRTLDVLHEAWLAPNKILIRDIGRRPCLAIDETGYCAGNTLYQLRSRYWPLPVLHAVLSVGLLGLAVASASAPTLGGHYRYQSQFLTLIRLPRWDDLDDVHRSDLTEAVANDDRRTILSASAQMLGVDELLLLENAAEGWVSGHA
jgi:adenine-specific DNA-methyltransferase